MYKKKFGETVVTVQERQLSPISDDFEVQRRPSREIETIDRLREKF